MSNKEMIHAFYAEVFNQSNAAAAANYLQPDYHQHNPGVTQGCQGFIDTFAEAFASGKKMNLRILDIIEEGDLAFVYLTPLTPDGQLRPGHTVMDVYRIQDGKLAEHWDVLE